MRASGDSPEVFKQSSPAFKICEFPPNQPSVLEFANFGGLFLPLFEHSFFLSLFEYSFSPIPLLALFFNKKNIFIL